MGGAFTQEVKDARRRIMNKRVLAGSGLAMKDTTSDIILKKLQRTTVRYYGIEGQIVCSNLRGTPVF
jgi:hypothetical protein